MVPPGQSHPTVLLAEKGKTPPMSIFHVAGKCLAEHFGCVCPGSAPSLVHWQGSCDAAFHKPSGLTSSAVTSWFFTVSLWRRMNKALAWDVRLGWVPPSARGFLSDHDKVALLFYLYNEDGISGP